MDDITKKTYIFDGGTIVEHEEKEGMPSQHRLVIGGIASEWTHWKFPAYLPIGSRLFVGIADGRAVLPRCFEAVTGSLIDG